jgi:hypothetical protein
LERGKLGKGAYGCIGRDSGDVDVVEDDVVGPDKEVGPAWRVLEVQPVHLDVGGVVREEEDGAVVLVVGVEDLSAREAIPPGLAVAIDDARAVDLDVPTVCQYPLVEGL